MSEYIPYPENPNENANFQLVPDPHQEPANLDISKLDKIKNQGKPKTTALVDIIKRKKGLYAKIKIAYHKKIDQDIDNGKKGLLDMDKFIYELIERGLKND